MEALLPPLMFLALLVALMSGVPVAFCLAGVGLGFAAIADALGVLDIQQHIFQQIPRNIFEKITRAEILMAVPMFVLMGLILERARIADGLLGTAEQALRRLPGGLALAVIGVGGLLAASTGIVGATVVTMTVLSLPTMLRAGYHPPLACGTIAASGTLGQIIPPSIVLLLLADQMGISPGAVFQGAAVPGLILVVAYMAYVVLRVWRDPALAPRGGSGGPVTIADLALGLLPPLALITLVLGSIFAGWATPTEAAGCGVLGALALATIPGLRPSGAGFGWRELWSACGETARINAMVFTILAGAQVFSMVFQRLDGDGMIADLVLGWGLSGDAFLLAVLLTVFLLGFVLDFLEICFVIIPILLPVLRETGYASPEQLLLVGVLLALNLQTSFLTPPFGFSLFYLKGVAPPEIRTSQIYRGVLPFVAIQLGVLVLVWLLPQLVLWLP